MGHHLSAVVLIKDEEPYLAQWIEYHIMHGFDQFLFYDNNSKDVGLTVKVLWPYIDQGIVQIICIPPHLYNNGPGIWAMQDAVFNRGADSKWLWLASIDEYIYCPKGETVKKVLEDFEDVAALAICWVTFNSSGKLNKEDDLVIARFTEYGYDPNHHVKIILRPERVAGIRDPHSIDAKESWLTVNEQRHKIVGPFSSSHTESRIRINHYTTMSKEEFEIKMNKGRADIAGAEDRRRDGTDAIWDSLHSGLAIKDDSLVQIAPTLTKALLKRYTLV